MDCVLSLWSDIILIICNTKNAKWFVWRDGLCEVMDCVWSLCDLYPSLHTNQTICNTERPHTIPSNKPYNVIQRMIAVCCVKGWIQVTQSMPSHKPDNMYYREGPTLHTKHLPFSVLCIFWFVWRHGLCDLYPSLHTNQIICITYYLVFVKGWIVWRDDKWYVWRDGLCERMYYREWSIVCVKKHNTENDNFLLHKLFIILCITHYLVCMKGYGKLFVWRYVLCEWMVLCEVMDCVRSLWSDTIHPFTQTR